MNDFKVCRSVKLLMKDYNKPWSIAGSLALDLFAGYESRVHDDVDIFILRKDQMYLQEYLSEWSLFKISDGKTLPWKKNEYLNLPFHEIHAVKENIRLEFLLNEFENGDWIYRRNFNVRRKLEQTILFNEIGIPFLCPEIVLLYKSKSVSEKDLKDYELGLKLMSIEQKAWLEESLV